MDIQKLPPDEEARGGCDQDSDQRRRPQLTDWGGFLAGHRDRLRRMVALRLDERLLGRIDPSDVIQEAFLEATEREADYEREAGADASFPLVAVPHPSAAPDRAPAAPRDGSEERGPGDLDSRRGRRPRHPRPRSRPSSWAGRPGRARWPSGPSGS